MNKYYVFNMSVLLLHTQWWRVPSSHNIQGTNICSSWLPLLLPFKQSGVMQWKQSLWWTGNLSRVFCIESLYFNKWMDYQYHHRGFDLCLCKLRKKPIKVNSHSKSIYFYWIKNTQNIAVTSINHIYRKVHVHIHGLTGSTAAPWNQPPSVYTTQTC